MLLKKQLSSLQAILIAFCAVAPLLVFGQSEPITTLNASDPITMRSHVNLDLESYYFFDGSTYYAIRPGFNYGLQNQKHLVGMSIPIMHNIFSGNYGGFENTTGVGDLKMKYVAVPVMKKEALGLQRVSTYLEITAPTGEAVLGRGAGVWQYKPGLLLTYRLAPNVSFYPEMNFLFSFGDANSQGDGFPDTEDPEADQPLRSLRLVFPAVFEIPDWDGWVLMSAIYTRSLEAKEDAMFLRVDVGRMLGDQTGGSIRISKYIFGQPRLNVVVQASFQFFLR